MSNNILSNTINTINSLYEEDDENSNLNEGWFQYWKTSSSLWKNKLEKITKSRPLFIPINWAVHFTNNENISTSNGQDSNQYDFGKHSSDNNIADLVRLTNELNLNAIFLLPITPNPLIQNGGLPAPLAKIPAISEEGLMITVSTADEKLNRIYSFFDPRIYREYGKFTREFGQFIFDNNLNIHVALLNCGHLDKKNHFISYFEDYSSAFKNGLIKYMEVKKRESEQNFSAIPNVKHADYCQQNSLNLEAIKRTEFYEIIKDLYITASKDAVKDAFEGIIDVAFLGGSPFDIINRSIEKHEHSSRYFPQIMQTKNIDVLPCILLLPKNIKQNIIVRAVNNFLDNTSVQNKLVNLNSYEKDEFDFSPLTFFHLYQSSVANINAIDPWKFSGLINYLDKNYTQTYTVYSSTKNLCDDDLTYDKSYFFLSSHLNNNDFYTILKIFMNGGNAIIDTCGISTTFTKKLDAFFIENSIPLQRINYVAEVTLASIGQGKMILFNRDQLTKESFVKKHSFWENIISYFNIDHLKINHDNDVYFQWKGRMPFHTEIEFIEIRRAIFYNPSSYKKSVKIPKNKNFILLKTIDEQNVSINMNEKGLDIDLLPNSSVGLDFGYRE
ncbi:MAG: hypothetical protein HQK51_00635 [Oligoflexia bacterium]|nr:hypothetical protein [Oligoflexia bacterium]